MNKCFIIGNLTRDPALRTTQSGISVCSFTVAVNRRVKQGEETKADYFNVSAWRELGENCNKYLAKGRKVAVVGQVSVSTYTGQDGKTYSNLDLLAENIEFLTPKEQGAQNTAPQSNVPAQQNPPASAFVDVSGDDELPF